MATVDPDVVRQLQAARELLQRAVFLITAYRNGERVDPTDATRWIVDATTHHNLRRRV